MAIEVNRLYLELLHARELSLGRVASVADSPTETETEKIILGQDRHSRSSVSLLGSKRLRIARAARPRAADQESIFGSRTARALQKARLVARPISGRHR